MLKPARANSWTVASCSEPFGMPSFSFMRCIQRSEAGAGAGVADVAVAQPLDLEQHRVVVAVHQQLDDLELVAGGFALHPQLVAGAAEEGGVAGAARFRERHVVHEADHQDFRGFGVLDDGGDQPVEF